MEEENPPEVTTFPPLESDFISHHEVMKSLIVHLCRSLLLFVGWRIISAQNPKQKQEIQFLK